jgi:CBS domain-containing protein
MNVNPEDTQKYLGIIEQRVKLKQTGAKWTQKNFTTLLEKSTSQEANTGITRALHDLSWKDEPVHKWPPLEINLSDSHKHFYTVSHLMKTDLTTVREDDILNLATNVMIWKNIRYIMVENEKHQLKGIISTRLLVKKLKEGWDESLLVKDLMESDLVTVSLNTSTSEAIKIMIEKNIGCLPVVSQKKLVGLITERDILSAAHLTQKFHLHDE